MDKLEAATKVTAFIFASGASYVAKNVLRNNLEDPEKLSQKIQIVAGSAVIGAMVGKQAKIYTRDAIDSAVKQFEKMQIEAKIEVNKVKKEEQDGPVSSE